MATRADSPPRIRVIRYVLAAIAVVAVAWFVVGARQAHLVDAATTLLHEDAGHDAESARHTESLLNSAAFLSPGTDVILIRAHLAMEQHAWTRAARLVHEATAAEPDNVQAWISGLDLVIEHPSSVALSPIVTHLRTLDPIDARGFKR